MEHEVLLLGSNYYNALSAVRSLGKNKIPFTIAEHDLTSYSLSSKYYNNKLLHFNRLTPDNEIVLLKKLIEWADQQDKKPVLLPTHDYYMLFVDKYLNTLKEHFLITLQDQGLAKQVMLKSTLMDLAQKNGLNVPKTINIDNKSVSKDNLEDLITEVERSIAYPFIIKPYESAPFVAKFRRKVFEINNSEELRKYINIIIKENIDCFIQQIIIGNDERMLLYDAYVTQNGEIKHEFTGQKLRQWPIKFGASCFMHSKINEDLRKIGNKFLKDISWRGFAEIEFKQDANDGKYYIIEINARHTNFNQLLVNMGFDITVLTYLDLTGETLSPPSFSQNDKIDYAFCYHHEDIRAKKEYIKNKIYSLDKIREQSKNKKITYAIWSIEDPRPFFKFFMNKFRQFVSSRF